MTHDEMNEPAHAIPLGELIDTLERMPLDAEVRFDFGAVPLRLCSWRGVYAELTLDNHDGSRGPPVMTLLDDAREAVGRTFEGYKGGCFVMDRHTPVWADPWGESQGRMIVGVTLENGIVVIKTFERPPEHD